MASASPIPGISNLYVGGLHVLNQPTTIAKLQITHVLSALKIELRNKSDFTDHLMIAVDDVEDENLLENFETTGSWIEKALGEVKTAGKGGVYVHCLMGISRSVTIILAYLLRLNRLNPAYTPAVALDTLQQSRPIACPNDGFMAQLYIYKEMGCPKDIESHPRYKRWLYMRDVELANAAGMAPEYILFEDEEGAGEPIEEEREIELKCKKCRRTVATSPYLTTHLPKTVYHNSSLPSTMTTEPISSLPPAPTHNSCTHHFLHPLSWMRPELEQGLLSGRLECPNGKCKAQLGRYAWQGMKCSCGIWVCPAFSLQKGRVDEAPKKRGDVRLGSGGDVTEQNQKQQSVDAAALGIRLPPGMKESL